MSFFNELLWGLLLMTSNYVLSTWFMHFNHLAFMVQ